MSKIRWPALADAVARLTSVEVVVLVGRLVARAHLLLFALLFGTEHGEIASLQRDVQRRHARLGRAGAAAAGRRRRPRPRPRPRPRRSVDATGRHVDEGDVVDGRRFALFEFEAQLDALDGRRALGGFGRRRRRRRRRLLVLFLVLGLLFVGLLLGVVVLFERRRRWLGRRVVLVRVLVAEERIGQRTVEEGRRRRVEQRAHQQRVLQVLGHFDVAVRTLAGARLQVTCWVPPFQIGSSSKYARDSKC